MRSYIGHLCRLSKDLLLGLLLFLLGLLLAPLVYLRGSTMPERAWQCLRVLLARGLFARFVRVGVEWRLGNFTCALSQLEGVVTALEDTVTAQQHSDERKELLVTVLQEIYTLQARMYLYIGHIDAALLLIVRVRKVLGIDRLPALPELDAKTAPLVRASIAAGRLLDSNGTTTLVVKTATPTPRRKPPPRDMRDRDAKVIPFPNCNPR